MAPWFGVDLLETPSTNQVRPVTDGRRPRPLVEGLIIVVSILLAFGIDAGWDAFRERADARQRLQSAQEELLAVGPQLEVGANYQRRVVEATQELARLIESVPEGEVVTTPDTLWAAALAIPDVGVPTEAVEALSAEGALSHVQSRSLRDSLGAWPSYLVDALANQREQWRYVTEEFSPLARKRADLTTAFALVRPWYRAEIPATRTPGSVTVTRELELLNTLAEREMNAALAWGDFEDLARHTAALAASITQELAR